MKIIVINFGLNFETLNLIERKKKWFGNGRVCFRVLQVMMAALTLSVVCVVLAKDFNAPYAMFGLEESEEAAMTGGNPEGLVADDMEDIMWTEVGGDGDSENSDDDADAGDGEGEDHDDGEDEDDVDDDDDEDEDGVDDDEDEDDEDGG